MQSKKLLSLLLATVMALSLIACDQSTEANGDVTSEQESQVSEDASENSSEETGENSNVIEGFGNNLVDGTNIIDDHFDDNTKGAWGVYANGGTFDLYAENGELVVDIKHAGGMEYAVQIFRDGYCLNMGCVYTVSFDIYSDIERDIEWRFQINGGDFHAYYLETERRIGPDKQTITAEFTMGEASDPAPRLCFNLGEQGDLDTATPHKVYIDNFVLTIKDASNAMALEPLPTPVAIKVNQVGYEPDDEKVLICKYNPDITDYKIVDTNGAEVYTGKLSTDFANSKSGDGAQVKGDFSDFTTPGTYKIVVDGIGESYEFTIAENIYDDLYKDVVRMLYLQRCGCVLDESLAGDYAHTECHMQETTVYETGEVIDVTGGWHDAGDYGRYVSPGAKTVMDLFITYLDSESARGDDLDIPESGNGVPDLLDEARYELEWMLKMQREDGGVYHKVTCANFPETVDALSETAPLIVCPVSPTATGDFAAVMAKASVIYSTFDTEFAATCKAAAIDAYNYLIENEESLTGFVNPEDIVTGEYPDGKFYDEIFWAAMELYLATGDTAYFDKAKTVYEENAISGLGWADIGYYGMYSYLCADDSLKTDTELAQSFINKMVAECNENIKTAEKDAYYISLERSYPWGSNMTVANHGILYYMAARFTGNETYTSYAQHQLNYLLGVNPLGYCYVTGYGSWSPDHTHHRPSQVLGQTMPGMLVGGPNTNADDPYAKAVLSSSTGGMCYVDNDSCFSTNEVTIYWNSPLIYLLAQVK